MSAVPISLPSATDAANMKAQMRINVAIAEAEPRSGAS